MKLIHFIGDCVGLIQTVIKYKRGFVLRMLSLGIVYRTMPTNTYRLHIAIFH
jgi:hypothetical protein